MADGLWFEAHATMARHPKTLKLARLLSIKRREAVGLLHDLFSWGLTSAQKYGELPGLTAEDIADAMDYPRKSAIKVVSALVDSGYLEMNDGVYFIHDWYDYVGKLYDSREKNREKNQRYRDRKKEDMDS